MNNCNYTVSLEYEEESNNSYIEKKEFFIKDCANSSLVIDQCGLWNHNKCPNDDSYCTPFVESDKIYLQYVFANSIYKYAYAQIVNAATDTVEALLPLTTVFGQDEAKTIYMNIQVDCGVLSGIDCWYIRIKAFKEVLSSAVLNPCVAEKVSQGMTTEQATNACYDELVDSFDYVYTEPYCRVKCDNETILITGSFPKYDCDGNYYGAFTSTTNTHIPSIRVPGFISHDSFEFTERLNNGKRLSVKRRKGFTLQTGKLPPYVVNLMAKCFESQQLSIDGVNYSGGLKLDKDFDQGLMWIVKTQVYQDCDENNFTCT